MLTFIVYKLTGTSGTTDTIQRQNIIIFVKYVPK